MENPTNKQFSYFKLCTLLSCRAKFAVVISVWPGMWSMSFSSVSTLYEVLTNLLLRSLLDTRAVSQCLCSSNRYSNLALGHIMFLLHFSSWLHCICSHDHRNGEYSGVDVVVLLLSLPPASYMRVTLSSRHSSSDPPPCSWESSRRRPMYLGPWHLCGRPKQTSRSLASAWHSSSCHSLLRVDPLEGRLFLSHSVITSFSNSSIQTNEQIN